MRSATVLCALLLAASCGTSDPYDVEAFAEAFSLAVPFADDEPARDADATPYDVVVLNGGGVATADVDSESLGRRLAVVARLDLAGARLAGLRVRVLGPEGGAAVAARAVVCSIGDAGVPVHAVADKDGAAFSWRDAPVTDGSTIRIGIALAAPAPRTFRVLLSPSIVY